jgi:hypothetical protein
MTVRLASSHPASAVAAASAFCKKSITVLWGFEERNTSEQFKRNSRMSRLKAPIFCRPR